MRKSSKLAVQALIAGIILFVVALPFSNHGWGTIAGGTFFFLSVVAAAVFVISGIYSLATGARAHAEVS